MPQLPRTLALIAVLVSGGTLSLDCLAQAPNSNPAPNPAPKPGDSKGVDTIDPKILEVLQSARAVMNDVQSLSYTADVIGAMPDGNRNSVIKANVVAERGDQGNWKYDVEGTFAIEGKGGGKRESEFAIRAAFDGTELLVVDTRRKLVRQTEPKEIENVRVQMNQGNAATSVAWELFTDPVLNGCDIAVKAEFEAPQTIDGLECDVIWFVPPKAKTAAGTASESAIVPSKIYFAKRDGLPRRFEIFRPATATLPADKRGEPSRTLTLSKFVAKAELSGKSFTLETPDGYTVTDGDGRRKPKTAAPKPKPETTPASTPDMKPETKPDNKPDSKPDTATPTTYKHPLLNSDNNLMSIGSMAPAFDLKDFEGKSVKLSDFKDKVLVLNFWGTGSDQSKDAAPAVQKVFAKYQSKGVAVLGLNTESNPKADPQKFMKDNGLTFPSVTKAETIAGLYRLKSWPTFYVIGKNGKVVWAGHKLPSPPGGGGGTPAAVDYLESNLSQAIDKALAEK
ncbi:MAG: redoxin domain-containing protein [Phycisphaerales bacterium]|nr:redoxin domain-containing protein [Phycisphaerales bacterium]